MKEFTDDIMLVDDEENKKDPNLNKDNNTNKLNDKYDLEVNQQNCPIIFKIQPTKITPDEGKNQITQLLLNPNSNETNKINSTKTPIKQLKNNIQKTKSKQYNKKEIKQPINKNTKLTPRNHTINKQPKPIKKQ